MSVIIIVSTTIGLINQMIPIIQKILKIFDQIIFQMAMSVCFLRAAITEVTSSGTDVPIATILAQISTVETLKMSAKLVAWVTNASHHTYNHATQSSTITKATGSE